MVFPQLFLLPLQTFYHDLALDYLWDEKTDGTYKLPFYQHKILISKHYKWGN